MRGFLKRDQDKAKLIVELSDQKGNCNRELSKKMDLDKERISPLTRYLKKEGIIYEDHRDSTNPDNKEGSEYTEKPFYIKFKNLPTPKEKLQLFEKIFLDYIQHIDPKLQERFLSSEYVNELIKEVGFVPVYNVIKNDIENASIKKSASLALLNQPALIKEYKHKLKIIANDELLRHGYGPCPTLESDPIDKLEDFDSLAAIEFYRKVINRTYSKLYRDSASNFSIPESMTKFTDYDVHLSPFTSFPKNDPLDLLIDRPYERIYNDEYILCDSDYENFVKRAYTVYSNFEDILLNVINRYRLWMLESLENKLTEIYNPPEIVYEEEGYGDYLNGIKERVSCIESEQQFMLNIANYIKPTAKLAIYYWNIAVRRFNEIDYFLKYQRPEKCYIHPDNSAIWITDLQSGERKRLESIDRLSYISLIPEYVDPFSQLEACNAFENLRLNTKKVTYEGLVSFLKEHINLQNIELGLIRDEEIS